VILQVAESEFLRSSGSGADQLYLSYQQIHAYVMRNFLEMPWEPHGEHLRAILNKKADKVALRKFAELV